MAIVGFNRKSSIFYKPLAEELRKEASEVLGVGCSAVWCRDLDTTAE